LKNKSCYGFTLIELLVAIAIMAGMSVMAWQGFDAMARTHAMAKDRYDKTATLNVGLQQWTQDLEMMIQTKQLSFIAWDGRVLRVIRRSAAHVADGVLVAAWTRGLRDEGGQAQWLRWQSKPVTSNAQLLSALEQAGAWAQSAGDAGHQQEVSIVPIESWQIYFNRGTAWTNPLSVDSPPGERATGFTTDSTVVGAAINGIRLVLTLPPGHPMGGAITRDWVRPTLSDGKS
jgi:general secretion pathway protein J